MIEITEIVKEAVIKSGIKDGICHVYTPHTTTSVMLFENVDPNLQRDFLAHMSRLVPKSDRYAHGENADAHLKSALCGASVAIPFEEAKLLLGPWQGVFFCEFDGPRAERAVYIKVIDG
jgi:secondary thiamine-phosphate synthase enzyme